jgi:GxxExxY protein
MNEAERINHISGEIVDAAIKVHKVLGPGLLESVYMAALAIELRRRGFDVKQEVPIRASWEGQDIGIGFRADMIVEDRVLVEGKAIEQLAKVHKRQLRTHVRLMEVKLGLLLNFGEVLMKDGIVRHVEGLEE